MGYLAEELNWSGSNVNIQTYYLFIVNIILFLEWLFNI